MQKNDLLSIVNDFYDAYNRIDIERMGALVADDVQWGHRGKFTGNGKAGMMETLAKWSARAPGRRMSEAIRSVEAGDMIFVEHKWFASMATDENGTFDWKAGDQVALDVASLFVFRDGLIIEWTDWG